MVLGNVWIQHGMVNWKTASPQHPELKPVVKMDVDGYKRYREKNDNT